MAVKEITERTRLEIEAGQRALRKHTRMATLQQWVDDGKIRHLNAGCWTVKIGDVTLVDTAPEHMNPSEEFFAQVALAVHAGVGQKISCCSNLACDGDPCMYERGVLCPDRKWK